MSKSNSTSLDEIFRIMQNELSDAWERYEGSEYDDDLDEYGELYEKAYSKAKAQIKSLILSKLPEKKKDTRGNTQNPDNPKYSTKFAKGYNQAIDGITKIVEEEL